MVKVGRIDKLDQAGKILGVPFVDGFVSLLSRSNILQLGDDLGETLLFYIVELNGPGDGLVDKVSQDPANYPKYDLYYDFHCSVLNLVVTNRCSTQIYIFFPIAKVFP